METRPNPGPQRFRISSEVIAHQLGEGMVLVHIDTNRLFELNSTATRLWQLLTAGASRAEAEQRLRQHYDVSEDQLRMEIDNILASLQAEKMLVPE